MAARLDAIERRGGKVALRATEQLFRRAFDDAPIGMAILATSSNSGTAFALPFVVLAACAAVTVVPEMASARTAKKTSCVAMPLRTLSPRIT